MSASFTLPLRVRFAETDAMAIVHHARYFEYFEAARVGLMDALGLPYAEFVRMGYHLPLVESHAFYRQPARFDDRLEIEAQLQPLNGPRLTITYKVTREGKLLAEGKTVHAFINKTGAAIKPPKEFLERMRAIN
jgi:acyl-CoA thioester hydrolase